MPKKRFLKAEFLRTTKKLRMGMSLVRDTDKFFLLLPTVMKS